MGRLFAKTMFGAAAKKLQAQAGSGASYTRLAEQGPSDAALGPDELDFIAERDSFYMATVTEDGWPYVQHRGGARGFLRVKDARTLVFADYGGNKQYISAGNLATDDRVALFLMDYPHQARLKILGHARVRAPEPEDRARESKGARVERLIEITVAGFDWNCSQHINPRYTVDELQAATGRAG